MLSRRQFIAATSGGLLWTPQAWAILPEIPEALTEKLAEIAVAQPPTNRPEHWSLATDEVWKWFERQTLVDGEWMTTGITTPVDIVSGERYDSVTGYLPDEAVPDEVRFGGQITAAQIAGVRHEFPQQGEVSSVRKSRHGRPASPWLRQLSARELRAWLATVEVPEAGVSGMTFWTHLTRDHGFEPQFINGLNRAEQAKLHAAAHFGY